MKDAMKPVLKLLFVALLVCFALSRPSILRASETYYQCDAQWTHDYSVLTQWMSQCMACTHQGGPPNYQYCYTTTYAASEYIPDPTNPGQKILVQVPSSYQTCAEINQSDEGCVGACVSGFNEQFQQYWIADCPAIS